MMDLGLTLRSLYPSAVPGIDYTLRDDGDGAYIETWNLGTKPDQSTLDAAALTACKGAAKDAIDIQAGIQRDLFVSQGKLTVEEYRLAYEVAQPWADGGYVAPAPASVSIWTRQNPGWTDQQAADDIINTRNTWMAVLANIRAARLDGKTTVDNATDEAGVNSARDAAIAALKAIHP